MKYIINAFKWAYGDSLKYIAFLLGVAAFVAALQLFIVYPVQVLATLIIGFVVWVLFAFFSEL